MRRRTHELVVAREVINDRVDKLEALGSADQIRDYFVQEHVLGQRCKRSSCVVARYLSRELEAELGGSWMTAVDGAEIGLYDDGNGLFTSWRKQTPEVIRQLINDFDGQKYPELELAGECIDE